MNIKNDIEMYQSFDNIELLKKKLNMLENKEKISDISVDGENIIMMCAAYGNSDTFDYLVSLGCKIDYENSRKYTPLHEACAFGKDGIVHYILHNNNKLIQKKAQNGRTILHEIFKYNQYNLLRYLLAYYKEHLNSLNIKDAYGKMPSDYTKDKDMQYLTIFLE
jgi:ankyrin repeat protein